MSILSSISTAKAAYELYELSGVAGHGSGVSGMDQFGAAAARFATKLIFKLRKRHIDMVAEMVELARSRVPVDTGALLNGITSQQIDDDTVEFVALAVRGDENYARDVEWGHNSGTVVVADDAFFAGRSVRGGLGHVAAEPFFFNSAGEILSKHGVELSDLAPGLAREEGLGD